MGQGNPRRPRVAKAIKESLAEMLVKDVEDRRVQAAGLISITQVEMNADMSVAMVYVSFIGGDDAKIPKAMEGLEAVSKFLRGPLGRRLSLKRAPELRFLHDTSGEFNSRLRDIIRSDEERAATREGGEGEDEHEGEDGGDR